MGKFEISEHVFTETIIGVLKQHFGEYAMDVLESSAVLGYLNNKTRAANRGRRGQCRPG